MNPLYLTSYNGAILGPIAKALGGILNGIYVFLSNVLNINSIALSIIILTCIIYLLLLPLTYRQQKFSVLTRKMQPELQAIQKKYKGKRDQQSMMRQQEETTAVYDKYGVSPSGSCIQMFIQLPILYALFYVFRNIPAYINSVKNIFVELVDEIAKVDGFQNSVQKIYEESGITRLNVDFSVTDIDQLKNYVIDVIYKFSESDWNALKESFSDLSPLIDSTHNALTEVNYFFILNISETPWNIIKNSWTAGTYGLLIAALLIPICSWLSQVLNLRLMPMAGGNDQMANQMRTMNLMMPIFSLVFTFSVPIGLGLYWIAGALFRSLLQVIFNKHFEKIDLDAIIEANKEKAEEKKEKRRERNRQAMSMSRTTQRSLSQRAKISAENQEILDKSAEKRAMAKEGSLASKANMVKDFNSRNNKK